MPSRTPMQEPLLCWRGSIAVAAALLILLLPGLTRRSGSEPALRLQTERFDRDPNWDGRNNRTEAIEARPVRQEFGYSRTTHAASAPGEVGGWITSAAEPAYYGQILPRATLDQPLSASGTLAVGTDDRVAGNTLVGFFNADTLNEWRTPSSIVLRVNGRGDGFHLHLEYATARWRAGGDFFAAKGDGGRKEARLFPGGKRVHAWSLRYDPAGANGDGLITAALDGEELTLKLAPGHKADGAAFNRFGILNVIKSADDGGELWLGDLRVNGVRPSLDRDPGWDGRGNHQSFVSRNVRPRFNFGYSATHYAAGTGAGEVGGLVFRGDARYPERMAYYAARVGALALDQPLQASGKVCFRRGVTDSTSLLGFFHSEGSVRQSADQSFGLPENFLGIAIEGPSREGFFFYPAYGMDRPGVSLDGFRTEPRQPLPPRILPDGRPHTWSLRYSPTEGAAGRMTVTLDGLTTTLDLKPVDRAVGARFNRFGMVTTRVDGNGQNVYYDDLTFTSAAP